MAKRMRVVTARDREKAKPKVVVSNDNPKVSNKLTQNELKARKRYATTTSMGGFGYRTAGDVLNSQGIEFYSPQLSTDFLEKPQNLRERRAFYRFFYNTNEYIGRAVDIHTSLPLSKLRLTPPKGKNKHQNRYIFKFFQDMCDEMKLFKTLIEITHDYVLMGNCLSREAEVRTVNGYKKAEDIQVGDLLLTHKGRYREVLRKFVRSEKSLLEIKCWKDYRKIPITEEHPIEVYRENGFEFIPAEELSLNDYIRITWPTEIKDIEEIKFENTDKYKKVYNGYELDVKIKHKESKNALEAQKKLAEWLNSLIKPVVITTDQLAKNLDISLTALHSAVYALNNKLEEKFYRKIGASGWQRGSQVEWLPLENDIEIDKNRMILRKNFVDVLDKIKVDNDFAYLVGYWLGDGTLTRESKRNNRGRDLWQVNINERFEGYEKIKQIFNNIFGKDSVIEWNSNGMKYLRIISNPLFIEWWAENFGETSYGKNNKKIPEWFLKLPEEKLLHFIAGIIDSDGCISLNSKDNKCSVGISMDSKKLMESIRDIVFKCGCVVNFNFLKKREVLLPQEISQKSKGTYEIITWDEESCIKMTMYSIKKIPENVAFSKMQRYWIKDENGNIAFKIKDINTIDYQDLVYNFEIEEDHTFQVVGFSTHNCFIFAEEDDWIDGFGPEEAARKKEEARQRSQFLKEKYDITDKNPLFKGWKKLLVLPPDQVRVRKLPLTDDVAIEFMPDAETRKFLTSDFPVDPNDPTSKVRENISQELREKVRQSGVIPMDTDPNSGSHVYHLARKKSQYEPLGVSIVERCVNTLVLMDKIRQAQTSIASRHMTPMRIVWAEGLSDNDVDNLREQVDLALVDPDFSIIANYEIRWEEMGSNGRLLDVEAEMEGALNRLLAGLGVTREVLTGEGTYTGSRISLEIMNTEYLLFRELLQEYVENNLFKPIARKKGFIEYDEYGNEVLLYPKLSFTRLAIRDNEQFFDAAFQLYQKGSISIDLILDILNIDADATKEKIEKDLFTVNDSLFNEMMRNLYTNISAPLAENTDLTQRLADYLGLNIIEQPETSEGESRFSSEQTKEQREKLAKIVRFFTRHPEKLDTVFKKSEISDGA